MYCLGASCLAPLDRHLTPLSAELTNLIDAERPPGRVLVLGGATSPLVELLQRRGHTVTVAEPTCWAQTAQCAWPAAEIAAFDTWDALDDFPRGWFDTVLLLGGVIEIGGPWWTKPSGAWSDQRAAILRTLPELVSRDGVVLADHAASSTIGALTYTAQGAMDGRTSITFAAIVDGGRSVMLTTHRYLDGIEERATLHTVGRAAWVDEVIDGASISAVSEGIWSVSRPQEGPQ